MYQEKTEKFVNLALEEVLGSGAMALDWKVQNKIEMGKFYLIIMTHTHIYYAQQYILYFPVLYIIYEAQRISNWLRVCHGVEKTSDCLPSGWVADCVYEGRERCKSAVATAHFWDYPITILTKASRKWLQLLMVTVIIEAKQYYENFPGLVDRNSGFYLLSTMKCLYYVKAIAFLTFMFIYFYH